MARISKYYPHVDPENPISYGQCDRGGEVRKRTELMKEFVWAGNRKVWNGMMVCRKHMDVQNEQDRTLVLDADPQPVPNPRPST